MAVSIEGSALGSDSADNADGYRPGSHRIATASESNSSRLTRFESTYFDSPAHNGGP